MNRINESNQSIEAINLIDEAKYFTSSQMTDSMNRINESNQRTESINRINDSNKLIESINRITESNQ